MVSWTMTASDDGRGADQPAQHQPLPVLDADGLTDGEVDPPAEVDEDALGVTVTVTVGAGRGRIETLGLCLGTWTTTPTTPSVVKLTNGRTSAVWVSEPELRWHRDDRADRHAGHLGLVAHRSVRVDHLRRAEHRVRVEQGQPEHGRPGHRLARPRGRADLSAARQLHAEQRRRIVGQQHRRGVLAHLR